MHGGVGGRGCKVPSYPDQVFQIFGSVGELVKDIDGDGKMLLDEGNSR
jgi:hypothetical protein